MSRSIHNDFGIFSREIYSKMGYNQEFEPEKISTLLVKKELKDKYDKIYLEINMKKGELLKKLKPLSGLKNDIDEELSATFNKNKNDFFICLEIL